MEPMIPHIISEAVGFGVDRELMIHLGTTPDEDLIAFADSQDDPDDYSDVQTYIFVHFFVFVKTESISHLEKAIIRTEGWAALECDTMDYSESTKVSDLLHLLKELFESTDKTERRLKLVANAQESIERYNVAGVVKYLDDSFDALKEAKTVIPIWPEGHKDFANANGIEGECHELRYKLTGNTADADRAIGLIWRAANGFPKGHSQNIRWLTHFMRSSNLNKYRKRTRNPADIEKMVEATNTIYQFLPKNGPKEARALFEATMCFKELFEVNDSIETLDQGIELATSCVKAASNDHPERFSYINSLANFLGYRFKRLGSLADLNKAIEVVERSLPEISTSGEPSDVPWYLINGLATLLGHRYAETKVSEDLDRAIELMEAINSVGVSGEAKYLHNLGMLLLNRFRRKKDTRDIDKSVHLVRKATEMEDSPENRGSLAQSLCTRALHHKDILGISEAIEAGERMVSIAPDSDPRLPQYLHDVGVLYRHKYNVRSDIADLNESIRLLTLAFNTMPPEYVAYSMMMGHLADCLRERWKKNGSQEDFDKAKSLFQRSISGEGYLSAGDVIRLIMPATRPEEGATTEERSEYLEKVVQMIAQASPMSMQQSDQQYMMSEFAQIPSEAAAAALDAGKSAFHALSLLEQGRGVITDHLMKMRTDISELEESHPVLANQFIALRSKLGSTEKNLEAACPGVTGALSFCDIATAGSLQNQRVEAQKAFDNLCAQIRELSGFENFLLPLTEEEMKAAADPDPIVVINLSTIRCDAFIVEKHQIRNIKLLKSQLTTANALGALIRYADSKMQPHVIRLSLEWMWDREVKPVLDALGFTKTPTEDNWPHIWWIPTGFLCRLPLHAAGYHFKFPRTNETVMDRVMSSYSSSIKALVYGRRRRSMGATNRKSDKVLIVPVPYTQGQAGLPYVAQEVGVLNSLCPSLHLTPVVPELKREDILSSMRDCRIFHFAGHGLSNASDPSKSGLLLKEGVKNPLTVTDLQNNQLQSNPPFLAYLSACSTGAAEAEQLLDEGINLISACQLAGFRHVIGTLWEVSDPHCVDVAKTLYETIRDEGLTDKAICRGLHKGVKRLRNRAVWRSVRSHTFPNHDFDSDNDDTAWEAFADLGESKPDTSPTRIDLFEDYCSALGVTDEEYAKRGRRGCAKAWEASSKKPDIRDETPFRNLATQCSQHEKSDEKNAADMARKLTVVALGSGRDVGPLDLYWVPYLHFGV
ncbi:hypothetical protein TWF191_010251 [Orbilia oligospora]|uniref:CHAT domain-containing protein n=1 Tax=Orbilia oligospora TaxID=2813651 RepID=A0A7C8R5T9_ORBOL|nr:hypothetical protein TWF191_010251 [Orbilia oligospora]